MRKTSRLKLYQSKKVPKRFLQPCAFSHTEYEMKPKRACERAVRMTISMPPDLWRDAVQAQQKRRYATFSDLIQELLRKATMPNNVAP